MSRSGGAAPDLDRMRASGRSRARRQYGRQDVSTRWQVLGWLRWAPLRGGEPAGPLEATIMDGEREVAEGAEAITCPDVLASNIATTERARISVHLHCGHSLCNAGCFSSDPDGRRVRCGGSGS